MNYKEIYKILHSRISIEKKRDRFYDYHDSDLADALENLDPKSRLLFYNVISDERLAGIIAYLEEPFPFLKELGLERSANIINEMDSDDAIDVLDKLDEDSRNLVLSLTDKETKEDFNLISSYKEDEIGSLMTTNFIVVDKNDSVPTAMNKMIAQAQENDNVSIIFVTDNDKYFGLIEIKNLFIARRDTLLETIVEENYPKFYDKELISEAYPSLTDYDLPIYPVINENNELVGVITRSDIIELTQEELQEDYNKFASLPEGDVDKNVFKAAFKRLPWLIILLVLGIFISLVISTFENVVVALPIIIFFQSFVLNMSGNVGTQSLAITIRLLTDEKITTRKVFKIAIKELRTGFIIGVLLAVVSSILMGLFIYITKLPITQLGETSIGLSFAVSGVAGLALIFAMSASSLFGCLIPIFFKKIHVDPSTASGPFITTISDVVAVLFYYGLAYLIIIGLIL